MPIILRDMHSAKRGAASFRKRLNKTVILDLQINSIVYLNFLSSSFGVATNALRCSSNEFLECALAVVYKYSKYIS